MTSRITKSLAAVFAVATALSAAACGDSKLDDSSKSAMVVPSATNSVAMTGTAPAALTADDIAAAKKTLKDPSKLTVCTALPFEPFEGQDANKKIVGFDIDFMDTTAKALRATTAVIDSGFEVIKSGQAMTAKTCDVAAAGMSITEERANVLTYSNPYYDNSQGILVAADSSIASPNDLRGKKIAVQSSTTGQSWAKEHASEYGFTSIEFDSIATQGAALRSGQVDAVIQDYPVEVAYAKDQKGSVKVVDSLETGEQYGFGVAKGNEALVKIINWAIATMQADGTYKASYDKWILGK